MTRYLLTTVCAVLMWSSSSRSETRAGEGTVESPFPVCSRLAHTYSIVARDPETGQLGVAVQSHYFAVGASVAWAQAGVGAVATQSSTEPSYGKLGLQMMQSGMSAPRTLKSLLAGDEERDTRQVALIDVQGQVAVHTGAKCIEAAGHQAGNNYSVQANLMVNDRVWSAMAQTFESTPGNLAERMMAALESAEKEGGDLRGKQSAALIVVSGEATGDHFQDRIFDLRVDDHPSPLRELRRLMIIQQARHHMGAAWQAGEKKDWEGVKRSFEEIEKLLPNDLGLAFWRGVGWASLGRVDDALPHFRRAFAGGKEWRELVPRLVKAGILPDNPEMLERILGLPEE